MVGSVIALGEMRAEGMTMVEVACRRCERRGRLKIERLIAEHGAGVLDLPAIIAADVRACRTPRPRSMTLAACTRAAAVVSELRRRRLNRRSRSKIRP